MSDVRSEELGTYEMLWDCPACGTTKLLGVTQRHCPNCGSPQDPKARYFPADDERVAVEDHPYQGADLSCPACGTPNASVAKHCVACGSPLEGAQQVTARDDVVLASGENYEGQSHIDARDEERQRRADRQNQLRGLPTDDEKVASAKKKRTRRIVAGSVAGVGGVAALFLWKGDVDIVAKSHAWERTIAIEQYGEVNDSAWCDEMPRRAKLTTKKKEVRSTKKVPDGETCTTRKKDMGNGSFKEVKECKPKYRSESVYDQKCYYRIDRWHEVRKAASRGSGVVPDPAWPEVTLGKTGSGDCRGCEREGHRNETYTVTFADADGETQNCSMTFEQWKGIADGDHFTARAGRVTGNLDCDSLQKK